MAIVTTYMCMIVLNLLGVLYKIYSDDLEIDFTLNMCTQGKRSNGFFLDVSPVSLHANMIPSVTVDQENFSLVNKLVVNLQVTLYKLKHVI